MNRHETLAAGPKSAKPIEVREGNTKLKIYRGKCRKGGKTYPLFTLAYYEGGKRQRKTFGSLDDAKREAGKIAARLEQGERDVLKLSNSDQQSFSLAMRELKTTGVPLLDAIRQYVSASKTLPADGSLLAAAKEYAQRHQENLPRRAVGEIIDEFLTAKEQDGASRDYLRTLRYHLNPLKAAFQTGIANVTTADLDRWLRSFGSTARTRKNAILSVTTLFRFARGLGYLTKNVPTEAEGVTRPKRVRGGEIGIISPEELAKILHAAADTEERRVYVALAAFTGVRAAELSRLEWSNINLAQRHVEITAGKSKTASRRLIPLGPAAYAWLVPYASKKGRLFTSQRSAERIVRWCGEQIGHWPQNALRHSFISHRIALTQDVARVALEAGNSAAMIHSNYRALVTPEAAQKWFAVFPKEKGRIIPIQGAA